MPAEVVSTALGAGRTTESRKRSAFTLVELLIVVAIIALLVTILMPAISGALELARQAVCLNNHRAIVSGVQAYHAEHRSFPLNYGDYGPDYTDGPNADVDERHRKQRWALAGIAPYLGGSTRAGNYLRKLDRGQFPETYVCPSADLKEIDLWNKQDKYHACYWTNIAIRANLGRGYLLGGTGIPGDDRNSSGPARLLGEVCRNCNGWRSLYNPTMQSVPLPAQTVFSGDTNNDYPDKNAGGSFIAYDSRGGESVMLSNAYRPGFWRIEPGSELVHGAMGFDRHRDRLPMSYLDGSAKSVTHRQLDDKFSHHQGRPSELTGDWMIAFPENYDCSGNQVHILPTQLVK